MVAGWGPDVMLFCPFVLYCIINLIMSCHVMSCTPSSSPSGRRARAGVHGGADAAAGCPRPSIAPMLFGSQDMDPDPSPRLRCTRCAAL